MLGTRAVGLEVFSRSEEGVESIGEIGLDGRNRQSFPKGQSI